MNKEALPLIIMLSIPIILVLVLVLHFYGYDLITVLKNINILYYIIIIPIIGIFIAAIARWAKER